MSSKVRFTILNKTGKVIRSINRPLLDNNTVKYKKKIYKLLKAPSLMRAKYVIIVDSESSTSVDYNKKIKLMSLEEFKNISHTEKQKSTGWTKVIYPGGSMVTDIKYGAKKDVYETLKLKGILPKTYKHKSKIHVKEEPQIVVYHGTDANNKEFLRLKKAKIPESIAKDITFFKPKYSKLSENSIFHMKHKNKPIYLYMYHPKRRELLVSPVNTEIVGPLNTDIKCHADLHALHSSMQFSISTNKFGVGGYRSDYDDFIKGALRVSDKSKNGLIEFHSSTEGWEKNPKLFDDIMDTLEIFKLNGANENTKIEGLGTEMKTMKQYS